MSDPVILSSSPKSLREVAYYESSSGAKSAQIPLELFPGFWGFAYLVLVDDLCVLVDTGSGFGRSNDQLVAGIAQAAEHYATPVSLGKLTHILITHGHIDHFGGLARLRGQTEALVGVHELDKRNISNYEERLAVVSKRLRMFFLEAGVLEEQLQILMQQYHLNKQLFKSVPVDFTFEATGMKVGPFQIFHVPGHCAGHVVLKLHNILFAGDHILSRTSPHMAPESLTSFTGLAHYLESIQRVVEWANPVEIVLGGHEAPVLDLQERAYQIRAHHLLRLARTLDILTEPKTIAEVSQELFGEPKGYTALLAIEEAGAHVEYLYQRSHLCIANLEDMETKDNYVPIKFVRLM